MSEQTQQIPAAAGVPAAPVRYAQALGLRLGAIGWPDGGAGEARALVRVDEFPHAGAFDPGDRFGADAFRRFHAVLADAGVPYLLAVTPRVARDYLDPDAEESRPLDAREVAVLERLREEGVTFALHGLDHRTRHASPRRHSELCGLSLAETAERLDLALGELAALGFEAPVFVPPFNRFDARQYKLLAERFAVVCGGPESVRLLGLQPGPARLGGAVYLPSYPPLYGRAAEMLPRVERMPAGEGGGWMPITLHSGWELEDGLAGLRRLCDALAGRAVDWGRLLTAAAGG
jgi:peptidoglycan/xylan/chitin deacetylase (PgdA/CDA1 family)